MKKTIIIVPCYNESKRIQLESFKKFSCQVEDIGFLFVDDGSTDETGDMLAHLRGFNTDVFDVLRLPTNVGKAEAIREGFLLALYHEPAYIGYWDADLATPLDAIPDFCRSLDQFPQLDLVMGARVILLGHHIDRHLFRHYLGRLSATVASLAIGIRVYDVMCGAKCFRVSDRTISIFSRPFHSRWVFDAELLARYLEDLPLKHLNSLNQLICELPLHRWREVSGSKLKWHDFIVAMADLAYIFVWYRCGLQGFFTSQKSTAPRHPWNLGSSPQKTFTAPTLVLPDAEKCPLQTRKP